MFNEVQIFKKIIIFIFTLDPICNRNHESSNSIKQNGRCSTKDRGNLSTCYRKPLTQSIQQQKNAQGGHACFPIWTKWVNLIQNLSYVLPTKFQLICLNGFREDIFLISLSQTRTAYIGHNSCPIDRHEILKYCTGPPLHHSYEVAIHCAS